MMQRLQQFYLKNVEYKCMRGIIATVYFSKKYNRNNFPYIFCTKI